MKIHDIFRPQKEAVISKWIEAVYATYPLETTGFLRTRKDPFTNPVGDMTHEAAGRLFDAVSGEDTDPVTVRQAIDRFVRLRAVQKMTPSQAIGVFFLLKPIMREQLLPLCTGDKARAAYLNAESRLDSIVLLAFDMYTEARETLAESRITEIRSQCAQVVRWAQTVDGSPVSGKS